VIVAIIPAAAAAAVSTPFESVLIILACLIF